MIDAYILRDIITDHNLCKTQKETLQNVIDKIEQGTMIELPRMFKAIDRTGWIVEFIDESGCVCRNHFFHEERAIKRLKELQNG